MAAMENVASIALTASLRTELSKMKPYAQPEDMLPDTPTGDSLSVDWFLDSPVGHGADELCNKEDEKEEKDSIFNHSSVSSCSFLSSEFSVPDDDLPDLEYLVSNLLDDSLCELSVPSNEERAENRTARLEPEPETLASMGATNVLFPCQVPGKARSKRPRPTNKTRTWFPLSEPSSLSSTLSNSLPTPCAIGMVQPVDSGHNFDEPSTKKLKKGQPVRAEEEARSTQFQRRCSHCQVQKTPQWRAGPLGPKTLCNACGVRHKSGRLFPEYRPACSPTFLRDIHSNSHRKVLEMRKRKGIRESVPGLSQLIPNF